MPTEEEDVIITTVKCVPHADAVEGSQKVAPAGLLDWSTVVAMDAAGRLLLLETMGVRPAGDDWRRKHFKNRSYQPAEELESPKDAVLVHLATLIGDQRLVLGWMVGFDLASLGLEITCVLAMDLPTDPVVCAFFQDLLKLGGAAKEVEDFILGKPELPIPITMACALFSATKGNLRYAQFEERDVLKDAYFISAIWRLLGTKSQDRRRDDATQLALRNAVDVGAGQPLERVLDVRQVAPADKRILLALHRNKNQCELYAGGRKRCGAIWIFL